MGTNLSKVGEANTKKCCRYIPDPIIAEIILRLPFESILKCMCVCRTWFKLISSSHFNDLVLKNRLQYMTFILTTYGRGYFLCEIEQTIFDHHRRRKAKAPIIKPRMMKSRCEDVGYNFNWYDIMGICNGLICSLGHMDHDPIILIWNPILGQYKVVPVRVERILINGIGFGYCQVSNQYKVLVISVERKKETFVVDVLTFGSSNLTWRKAGEVHGYPNVPYYNSCCFQGSILWICGCNEDSHSDWICCFDIRTEKQRSLCPPHDCAGKKRLIRMQVVRDSLCIVVKTCNGFLLWSMKDCYGGGWVRNNFIDLSCPIPITLNFVTTLWEENKEILALQSNYNFAYYDYKKSQYIELKTTIDSDGEQYYIKSGAYGYLPSFLPLSQVFKEEERPLKMVTQPKNYQGCFEFFVSILWRICKC